MPDGYDFGGTLPRTPMTIDPGIWTQIKENILGLGAPAPAPEQDYNDFMMRQAAGPEAWQSQQPRIEQHQISMTDTPGYDIMSAATSAYDQLAARRQLYGQEGLPPFDEMLNAGKQQPAAPWDDTPRLLPYQPTDPGAAPGFLPGDGYQLAEETRALGEPMMVDYPTAASDPGYWPTQTAPGTPEEWLQLWGNQGY